MKIISFLSETLYLPEHEVAAFINTAPYRYKEYSIPKRSGTGTRQIAQPSSELKVLQTLAIEKIKKTFPIHLAAMAYREGLSIKDNASRHVSNKYLLKMDFENFFHSLVPCDLLQHTTKYHPPISEDDKKTLSKLFFWATKRDRKLKLSIGAPSSPFISNTLLYDFDEAVSNLCKSSDITYTRYADDLTFTTNKEHILFNIPTLIQHICENLAYPKLTINKSKTVFSSKKHNRHITGITITNEATISLGRQRKRYIRSLIHQHILGKLSLKQTAELKGLLAFSKHIELTFYKSLIEKYSFHILLEIQTAQTTSLDLTPPQD